MANYYKTYVEKMKEQKHQVVSVWLPAATVKKIDRLKKRNNDSRGVIVKQAVDAFAKAN